MIDSRDSWLEDVRRALSPNFNRRPSGVEISLLVIHNISLPAGRYGEPYIEQLFTNCLDCSVHSDFADLQGLELSSHLLIDREGVVTQFVPFNGRAWHAGVSIYQGIENCNDYSIGIELEGVDDSPYTDSQYHSLVSVSQLLMGWFPLITANRIVGHNDIAPGRKTDPGPAFNWDRYLRQLPD